MKIYEITKLDVDVDEAVPSTSYCQTTPASDMSASWLASCKSQGYKSRSGKKSHKIGKKRITVGGKKIRGKAHGGALPDWGTRTRK